MTTQHLSECLAMPYVHPALNAGSKSKYLAPQGERPSAYQISPAPSCQDPFSGASISPGSLLSQMRVRKGIVGNDMPSSLCLWSMASNGPSKTYSCTHVCTWMFTSLRSLSWQVRGEMFTGYDINMINRDSCWRVISDIQDDFALIRQLSFGKIKEMLCSVFTFSTMH